MPKAKSKPMQKFIVEVKVETDAPTPKRRVGDWVAAALSNFNVEIYHGQPAKLSHVDTFRVRKIDLD